MPTYAVLVRLGEEILVGNGRRFRVLEIVPFEEEDESQLGERLAAIGDTLRALFTEANADGITPAEAADRLVRRRLAAA